jgi:type IV secretory pathway VirJ component
MRRMIRAMAGAVLVSVAAFPESASAAPRTQTVSNETLGPIEVLAPAEQPNRFVVFISDADGMTPARLAEADAIVARGAAVALIDLPKLQEKLAAATDEECYYVFGDVEDLARTAQRQLGMTEWRWPIMFGTGDGGTLAYLMLAQAPDNTAGGAVSIGFTSHLKGNRPLCPGAPMTAQAGGIISYKPFDDVPGPWVLVPVTPPDADVQAFIDDAEGSRVETAASGDPAARFAAALDALFTLSPSRVGGLSDLPLVELPGTGTPSALFILMSGDGGWRDIDKEIGEYLAQRGVSVVGVDSLRYFWSRREPRQIASDIARIAEHYVDKWKLTKVGLGGYSFGADAIPLAWTSLPREDQARIGLIALLGLETTADLQVSVTGFLGIKDANDIAIAPHLPSLPKNKVVCFYGSAEVAEKGTACIDPGLDGATRVERPGGHHFDGNYQPVADIILQRLK